MFSIDRLKEMALEDIENNPEKHLEEYAELLQQLDQLNTENEVLKKSVRSNKDKRKRAIEKYLKLKEFTNKEFNKLKAENEKMLKGYEELTEIVSPYIDDFTGYNEELGGFDIVLCVKELMQQLNDKDNKRITILTAINDQLKVENEHLAEKEEEARHYLEESYNYKQALQEIIKIAEPYQKEIKKICGNCNNYDDCHACCKFDLNCYQYKKGDTTACEKFIVSWKYDKNELANKILQKCEVLKDVK